MLTLKLISEETERVVKGLEKKHFPNAREAVEKVLEYDKIRREAQQKLDTNKQQANQFAKQIGALMKEGKKEEAEAAKAQVANLKADGKALEEIMEKAQQDMTNVLLEIPNIPCDEVPEGKDAADNVVVKEGGEKPGTLRPGCVDYRCRLPCIYRQDGPLPARFGGFLPRRGTQERILGDTASLRCQRGFGSGYRSAA